MKTQHFYSRIVTRGRRANPTYAEAKSDLAKVREIVRSVFVF